MSNNLTLAMHHYGKLSQQERDLFLSVISSEKVVSKPVKQTKKQLPYQYSEEYFYESLKAGWNESVRKRMQKNK